MEPATTAGLISTTMFAVANLPMLVKAVRTHDLESYSLWYLLIANLGNLVHTAYVVSLPMGPIWLLHGFYLVTMAVMLALYLRAARTVAAARGAGGRTLNHGQQGDAPRRGPSLRRVR